MPTEIKDPGIGTQFDKNVKRMINADGSYNVERKGARRGFKDVFKYLLEISWTRFFLILFSSYILINILFTFIYLLVGFDNIAGIDPKNGPVFFQAFFFSIQTFTTVGYGTLSPLGVATQSIAAIEAFVGFMTFALATGLLYGRFSRPQSKLMFADNFVYSKFEDGHSFKFKLTNLRDVVLQDVEAKIICMFTIAHENGQSERKFYRLNLTIPHIEILALTWTLVHKIDEDSPFWMKSKEEIINMQPEFLVLVHGYDEVYAERTRARKSYIAQDIIWNKNFDTIFQSRKDGMIEFDVRDLNKVKDE
ncbi:ion channel [Paracrocinitomix mangrovi]|uniref:ion channel n=1 Tax=Paracrocinitomix mangrovi TaxID=2862509 RepID=UPI001C8DB60C|nr:ion channel [Paracrocinitomix mangrovi]UKN01456.1 ion channel [Paracrocinitomix mangrovi]